MTNNYFGKSCRGGAWLLAGTMIAGIATPAIAQSATPPASDSEIIVTAQRRAEKQTDVPITLTTIGKDTLDRNNVRQISDLGKLTPGLRVDFQGGSAQPTIRGVGTAVSASGSGSNVGIYVDGFYAPNPFTSDLQLLNVSSVQVLKGPQGTLFGRNSTGGAILVTTTEPSADTQLVAEASYGRFNTQKYQAYATTGSDTIAFDIAGMYRQGDGFVRNIVTGRKDGAYDAWSVRAGVKAELGDVKLVARYTHSRNNDPTGVVFNSYNGLSIGNIIPDAIVATRPNEVSSPVRNSFNAIIDAYQLKAEADLGGMTLTSYTQYRDESSLTYLDLAGASVSVFDVRFLVTDKVFTQELLLASKPGSALQWTTGIFYFADDNRFRYLDASVSGGAYGNISKSQTDTRSIAWFADVTYQATDKLFLTAGVRYSHDKVKNGAFTLGPLAGDLGTTPIPTVKTDRVTPRAVIRYKPDEDSSIYASYTQGLKAPILNPNGFSVVPIKPEKISAYEAGYKYSRGGLSFNASAFYYDYKDLQVSSYNGTQALVTNAASSTIKGIEAQLSYAPTSSFDFDIGGTYIRGRYKRFLTSPSFSQCLVPECGDGYGTFVVGTTDASGFEMARTPKFSGNAGARYRADAGGGKLVLSGSLTYTSSFYFDTSQQFRQSGYALLGARAEWTDPSDRFTLAVYGENLTNKKYYQQILAGQFAVQSTWGYPVTYGASVRVRY